MYCCSSYCPEVLLFDEKKHDQRWISNSNDLKSTAVYKVTNPESRDQIDWIGEKAKVQELVAYLRENRGAQAISSLRSSQDTRIFQTFCDYVLIHFADGKTFRKKSVNEVISKMFTPSCEAMAILLLENNIDDLSRIDSEQVKLDRKDAQPRYTKSNKGASSHQKFQGWSQDGIKRYNDLLVCVKQYRSSSQSQVFEEMIKGKYRMYRGFEIDNNGNWTGENMDCLEEHQTSEAYEIVEAYESDYDPQDSQEEVKDKLKGQQASAEPLPLTMFTSI